MIFFFGARESHIASYTYIYVYIVDLRLKTLRSEVKFSSSKIIFKINFIRKLMEINGQIQFQMIEFRLQQCDEIEL